MTKFKCKKKNEKDSARSSKMTPSWKWPVTWFNFSCYHPLRWQLTGKGKPVISFQG